MIIGLTLVLYFGKLQSSVFIGLTDWKAPFVSGDTVSMRTGTMDSIFFPLVPSCLRPQRGANFAIVDQHHQAPSGLKFDTHPDHASHRYSAISAWLSRVRLRLGFCQRLGFVTSSTASSPCSFLRRATTCDDFSC